MVSQPPKSIKRYHYLYVCLFIGIAITIFLFHSRSKSDKIKIICYGDSIVKGTFLNNWPGLLQKKLDVWRPGQYKVVNKGVSGATSLTGLRLFGSHVSSHLPGYVLVAFGINDANYRSDQEKPRVGIDEYRQNMTQLCEWITSQQGHCVLIMNHPLKPSKKYQQGNHKTYNENLKPYNTILGNLSEELNIPVIDMYSQIGQIKDETIEHCLQDDGVHLTQNGTDVYAESVFQSFKKIIDQH